MDSGIFCNWKRRDFSITDSVFNEARENFPKLLAQLIPSRTRQSHFGNPPPASKLRPFIFSFNTPAETLTVHKSYTDFRHKHGALPRQQHHQPNGL